MLEAILVSSLEKVGLSENMEPLEKGNRLRVFAGETVSFQIAFRQGDESVTAAERGRMRVNVGIAPSRADSGNVEGEIVSSCGKTEFSCGDLAVRLREVLPVMCRKSCDPGSNDGDYLFYDARMAPDLLRDFEGETEVNGGWRSLWVDVCAEATAKGGAYRLEFSLAPVGDGQGVTCGVDVSVCGRRLPGLSIPHTEWFHYDGIADYYGVEVFSPEFWRILRNFIRIYVKRHCNTILTPIVTPPLDTEQGRERTTVQLVGVELGRGEYRLDFTNLENFLDICLEEGIQYFEMCHLFTQWGATAAPKVVAKVEGETRRIFGWETPSDDPEYQRFLATLLPALKELLTRRGLLDRTFFHISDEPDLSSVQYRNAQSKVRGLLEGCTIMEAVSDYEYYEKGLVDIPVCAVNHIEPFLEKRPPRLWSYYCCAQTKEVPNRFISMPSWRNRIYGVLLYWLKIDGFLHWGFNFYNSGLSREKINPYETPDAGAFFPAGDPFLVYPGEDGRPEESIRLMVLEEAVGDYRALVALEADMGRDAVMELIRREAGMELSFRQYPRDAAFILKLREKVDGLLAERAANPGKYCF